MATRPRSVLAVNPGGTSTKVALFEDERAVFTEDLRHDAAARRGFARCFDELGFRLAAIRELLDERSVDLAALDAVVGRGGPVAPVPSGAFAVDAALLEAIAGGRVMVDHPSLLGAPLAKELSAAAGCPAYVVDPVSVDELVPEARLTGLPEIARRALSHALNVKSAAREAAARLGRRLEDLDLVVLHLGSGFTVAAEHRGRQIDSNDASASGPMAPTRAGSLPTLDLARLCCAGERTFNDFEKLLVGGGGWTAHLGTDDIREIYRRIDAGDERARLVHDATLLGIAKEAAAMAAALGGRVDALVLTGGVVRSERFVAELSKRLGWLSPTIVVLPGENEMLALTRGALRVLSGEAAAQTMGPYIEKFAKERR